MDIKTRIRRDIEKKAKHSEAYMKAFGWFGVINYPVFYIVWSTVSRQPYEDFTFRLIAGLLCLPLIFISRWPQKLYRIVPIYWFTTVLICLPIFCTYMFLKNHGSNAWVMNGMLVLFLLILIVDWQSFIFLIVIGVGIGWIMFTVTIGQFYFVNHDIFGILSSYVLAIIIGVVFSRNQENHILEQIQNMKSLSASIAHELRTPLRTINSGIECINKSLPTLMHSYEMAKENQVLTKTLDPYLCEALPRIFDNVESEIRATFTIIDILLVKLNEVNVKSIKNELISIQCCVQEAVERYPFDIDEKKLVTFAIERDFIFHGDKVLMIHVLYNLLKNALYYIRVARKGNITIWLDRSDTVNTLYFRDTGQGISSRVLPQIFERFYSQTHHGTGIGLPFCRTVMQKFGGEITCRSQEGEFTEFILTFPVIKETNTQ